MKSIKIPVLFFVLISIFAYTTSLCALDFDVKNISGGSCGGETVSPVLAHYAEKVKGLKGLSNVGKLSQKIYRGAQPTEDGYKTLKDMGIKTVINLRTTKHERSMVESNGMKSIEIPMNTFSSVNDANIKKAIDIIKDPNNQPVYVHCRQGKDRTGVVMAIYRMEADGWPKKDAIAEMESFGFNDVWTNLKRFVEDYNKCAT